MREQLVHLPRYLGAHLLLTLAALCFGVTLSVPLGILASRVRALGVVVLGAAGVLQTVPSLALLAFLVPVLAALGAPSIGYLPALIGLSVYSVLPILRNTVIGLSGVDPALIEAARGVGMTPGQQLRKVELPLALPVIIGGVRTAAVWTVGTATLSTPIGASSLGDYIFGGLQTRNHAAVLVGCAGAAGLALLLDGTVRLLQHGIEARRRAIVALAAAILLGMGGLSALPFLQRAGRGAAPEVVVGAKTFTEQYILGRALAGWITRSTGQPARLLPSLGSSVAFDALRAGEIDLYVDYTGTLWSAILRHRDGAGALTRGEVLAEARRALRAEHGVELVAALGFENRYALAMRRGDAERLGVRRVSDLLPHAGRLSLAGDYEIFQRAEWRAIEGRYGLSFRERRSMDPALMYEAARSGGVDVITAFSTDGRLVAYDLAVLADDRGALPPYDAVILAGARLTRERPVVIDALRELEGRLPEEQMRRLNAMVDQEGRTPEAAAAIFLSDQAAPRPKAAR